MAMFGYCDLSQPQPHSHRHRHSDRHRHRHCLCALFCCRQMNDMCMPLVVSESNRAKTSGAKHNIWNVHLSPPPPAPHRHLTRCACEEAGRIEVMVTMTVLLGTGSVAVCYRPCLYVCTCVRVSVCPYCTRRHDCQMNSRT